MRTAKIIRVRRALLCGCLLGSVTLCFSQISKPIRPYSERYRDNQATRDRDKLLPLPAPPLELVVGEKKKSRENERPYHFAYEHIVSFSPKKNGVWHKLPTGGRLWRLAIQCPEAQSIYLAYRAFWLPEGATLHLYDPMHTHELGAFTSQNNKGSAKNPGGFATALVPGNTVILEYYEPKKQKNKGIISIDRVFEAYR